MATIRGMSRGKPKTKLGDILTIVKGKKHLVCEGNESGLYPLLRSSKDNKVKWLDTHDYEGPYITVGTGGYANFNMLSKF